MFQRIYNYVKLHEADKSGQDSFGLRQNCIV